jgi:AAA+ superfamily predicted ATPase
VSCFSSLFKSLTRTLLQGPIHDNSGILILAATNLRWGLDPAIRRSFQKKIRIPLPNERGRGRLIEINVENIPCGLSEKGYTELSSKMLAPEVVADDFYTVLPKAKPSVGQDEIQKFYEWRRKNMGWKGNKRVERSLKSADLWILMRRADFLVVVSSHYRLLC